VHTELLSEYGRKPIQCQTLYNIGKFWMKTMQSDDYKYIKIVNNTSRNDTLKKPACTNLCSFKKHLLQ